jgi:hypothetical protein
VTEPKRTPAEPIEPPEAWREFTPWPPTEDEDLADALREVGITPTEPECSRLSRNLNAHKLTNRHFRRRGPHTPPNQP